MEAKFYSIVPGGGDIMDGVGASAAGFGIGWVAGFGRIELVYASKVLSRPGDLVSEFQVIFSD